MCVDQKRQQQIIKVRGSKTAPWARLLKRGGTFTLGFLSCAWVLSVTTLNLNKMFLFVALWKSAHKKVLKAESKPSHSESQASKQGSKQTRPSQEKPGKSCKEERTHGHTRTQAGTQTRRGWQTRKLKRVHHAAMLTFVF